MVKEFILIRHGEGEHQVSNLIGGWSDVKLTDIGVWQAEATSKRIVSMVNSSSIRLFSSDLERAAHTAKPIAEKLGIEIEFHQGLREISRGDAHNQSKGEAKKLFQSPREPLLDWQPYPNSESWRMFQDRIYPVYEELSKLNDEIVIIVSHRQTQICFTQAFLGLPRELIYQIGFGVDNCSITVLNLNEYGEKNVEMANDTCHLRVANT